MRVNENVFNNTHYMTENENGSVNVYDSHDRKQQSLSKSHPLFFVI